VQEGHVHAETILALDIREAARRLSLSPRTVAALVSTGELQSRKVGRRRIIPVSALEKFLARDHSTNHDNDRKP
jgi:excisionase family DNA binding protein